jgi:glycosyltransferase involved in cell wall biosynthesis
LQCDYYRRFPDIDKVREIYNRSKVWFSTSKDEGLPNPILEAMACGAAVVSSDNPGSRELIQDGRNGLIIKHGDNTSMVEKIIELYDDEQMRTDFANRSKEIINMFDWEIAVNKMTEILDVFKSK